MDRLQWSIKAGDEEKKKRPKKWTNNRDVEGN